MMVKPRCNRRSGWGKGLFNQKSTGESVKDEGVVGFFFYWKGTVHHEFVPRGQMVNKQLYQEILARLRDAVRRKRPELWVNQTWMLHHDNAPAHASLLIRSYLAKHQTSVVPHPPYSPDLTPADFFLFPKLKTTLKGHHFQTTEEIQEIRLTAYARAPFIGCSSTKANSETGQMAAYCQNLMLGALSSRSALPVLVGMLFKKFGLFLNMPRI